MTAFASVPAALGERLAAAGLDPRKVYDDVVAALEEDLPGEDVTSVATIDPADVPISCFARRKSSPVAPCAPPR